MPPKPAWLEPHGSPWRRGAEQIVFENPWMRVTSHQALAPTGHPATYGVVGFKNYAIAILPLHEDGAVTLVGQHRFVFGDYSWEIPEGGGPRDKDPLESAKRELAEETGLQAGVWRQVLETQLSNSVTDEQAFGFLAYELAPAAEAAHQDETEALTIVRVPFREALEAALAGHLKDMLTVAMLLRAYHMAKEGGLPRELAEAMLG
jgi:8-oxo-dGDP phosphatase